MARRPSKTFFQPDQHDLFAQIRARLADVGTLGQISWTLSLAITIPVLLTLLSTGEDFWLRTTLMSALPLLLFLFVLVILTEIVRSMRWCERKDFLAGAQIVAIIGYLVVIGFLVFRMTEVEQIRLQLREAEVAAKAKGDAEARDLKAKVEACEKKRDENIKLATQRRADMRALFQRCKDSFEKSKDIFTQGTVEQHCKTRQGPLNAADREIKAITSLNCEQGKKYSTKSAPRTFEFAMCRQRKLPRTVAAATIPSSRRRPGPIQASHSRNARSLNGSPSARG